MGRNIILSVGEFYHVYSRGTEKRIIFNDEYDYNRFVLLLHVCNNTDRVDLGDLLRQGLSLSEIFEMEKGDAIVDIGVWCLMPNHFHLLLKEKKETGISVFMKKVLTAYSMYFNRKYHRTGSLFEGIFKAKHLDYDQYLKYQFAYIHLNPISLVDSGWKRKEIVDIEKAKEFLNNYKYSSYLDYLGVDRPERKIINRKEFPEYFGSSTEFSRMIDEWMNFETILKSL